jgi:hypothetical protein
VKTTDLKVHTYRLCGTMLSLFALCDGEDVLVSGDEKRPNRVTTGPSHHIPLIAKSWAQ